MQSSWQKYNIVEIRLVIVFSSLPGLYTVIDMASGLIIDTQPVHVCEADSSVAMEKHGLDRILSQVKGNELHSNCDDFQCCNVVPWT